MTIFAVRTLVRVRTTQVPAQLPTSTSPVVSFPPPFRSYSSLRPAILNLPSTSSTRSTSTIRRPHSLFKPHQSRLFSLLPLVESTITTSQTLLTTLHTATGTPWYLTIPLFALNINLLTRLPTTFYSRHVAVRRQLLHPLTRAWAARVGAAAAKAGQQQLPAMDRMVKEVNTAMATRHRRWRVQRWKDWVPSLVVFPVWMAGIEALRRLCGGPRGLLGTMVFGPGKGVESGVARAAGAAVDDPKVVTEGAVSGTASGAGDLGFLATTHAEIQDGAVRYLADPSLAAGGCLWFPDLTAADPLHVLPLALSAILVVNVMPKSMALWKLLLGLEGVPASAIASMKVRLRLQRAFLLVAMAAGPLTMDLPAALHLYWISSAALTTALTSIISRLMPMPKIVSPAKSQEPMFVMPTREEGKKTP